MAAHDYVALGVIGLIAGMLGGLLGIGGSIVMIPALTEVFGPDQHLFQASAMIVNVFVAVPAVVQHRRAGAIERRTVARLLPFAIGGVLVGVAASELSIFGGGNEPYLRGLFGVFLLAIAGKEFVRAIRRMMGAAVPQPDLAGLDHARKSASWRTAAAVALPTGFVAGLLGVGGGVLAVPLQRRFLRLPLRNAVSNSAAIIVATSVVGATAKNIAYVSATGDSWRSLVLAAVLAPTAIVGSVIGARWTHRAPLPVLHTVFFVLLGVAAVRLVYGAIVAIG